jgi:hypothetical protein
MIFWVPRDMFCLCKPYVAKIVFQPLRKGLVDLEDLWMDLMKLQDLGGLGDLGDLGVLGDLGDLGDLKDLGGLRM